MDALQIGSRREVCWDEMLMDTAEGVKVQMHRPEYKGVALELGELWEGNGSGGYGCVLQDNGTVRLYYRGLSFPTITNGKHNPGNTAVWCLAESKDGKTFTRVYQKVTVIQQYIYFILLPTVKSNDRKLWTITKKHQS